MYVHWRMRVCAYAVSVFVVLSKRVYHFTMEVCDTDSYDVASCYCSCI